MIVSACLSRPASRSFSRRSRSISCVAASLRLALRPRRFGVSPASTPSSRCRRQLLNSDEYRPSRGNNCPNSPGSRCSGSHRRGSAACRPHQNASAQVSLAPPDCQGCLSVYCSLVADPSSSTSLPSTLIKEEVVVSPILTRRETRELKAWSLLFYFGYHLFKHLGHMLPIWRIRCFSFAFSWFLQFGY